MIGQVYKRSLLLSNLILNSAERNILNKNKSFYYLRQLGSDSAAYDGDGRTTVRVLNDEEPHLNLVNTYSHKGFRLSNNLFITGSILLFPTFVFSWNVRRGIDITPESLIVFDLIVPKTKIIIIGYGAKDEPYDASIPLILKKKGLSCEMLPTPSAVTTYNYLVHDSVHVAGAFVPVLNEVVSTAKDYQFYHQDYIKGGDYLKNTDQSRREAIREEEANKKNDEYERTHSNPEKKQFDDY